MLRVPLPVALLLVAATVALSVVLFSAASHPARASSSRPVCALRPITARSSIAELARHFGPPTWSRFRAGSLTSVWIAHEHNWTLLRYLHPKPRPGDAGP